MNSLASNKQELHLQGLYFDGRKDHTLTHREIDAGRLQKRIVVEDHITLLKEPDSQYVSHFATTQGSSQAIFSGIVAYLNSNVISFADRPQKWHFKVI